jgi:3-deoxy-manno-octulosonate cytidylyltransferase (CMP-KDO synthetase)
LVASFSDESVKVATPALRCDEHALTNLKKDRSEGRVGGTTVVFNHYGDALYFSKEVLPYIPENATFDGDIPVFHHVGVYAYRKSALEVYGEIRQGTAEKLEGLEQLRFLEAGVPIRCVKVSGTFRFWELNNPTDVPIIESCLAELGIE